MKLLNYLINNINSYYSIFNLSPINNLINISINELNHINIYGSSSSFYHFFPYYIINLLTKSQTNIERSIQTKKNINVNNNNIDFNVSINTNFIEINLFQRSNYDRFIITKYILEIVKNKNFKNQKHIILIRNFDRLNFLAYMSIRRILEVYSENVLFIFTSNYLSKIPDAIKSRIINIRSPMITTKQLKSFFISLTSDLKINKYNNNDINKIIKNIDNDINKLILYLENDNLIYLMNYKEDNLDKMVENISLNEKNTFKFVNVLEKTIKNHINYIKKTKNNILILKKNRKFIYDINHFNYNIQTILETFVKLLLKYPNINKNKVIKLTCYTDINIINSNRDLYHLESYLIEVFNIIHNS